MRAIMLRAFGDGLANHLHAEMPTVTPEKIHQVGKSALDSMIRGIICNSLLSPPLTAFPFILAHHDYGQPPMPGPIMWIGRNVVGRLNQSFRQFAPFDLQGNPQTYQ
ncbi:hypothetical protein BDZ89DRAFT_1132211 [Hymenopellis radicata]|nr:hypothetical protein BDZ89DRAFT_1132211 [Hymenopellis radicata]